MTWSERLRDPGFRQLVRMGRVAAAKQRPELPVHLGWYFVAFYRMGTSRALGGMGGAGPIPWHVKDQFARRYGIEGEAYERFERLIDALDAAWLDAQHEAAERRAKDAGAKEREAAPKRRRRIPMKG